jgi:4-hydroxy-tetrahydrodipicolinate reductase
MTTCRIGILGCAGRMGRMLIQQTLQTEGAELAGGIDRPGTEEGRDLAELVGLPAIGVTVGYDAAELFKSVDAVIDFTSPHATAAHAALAATSGCALIVGTTGLGAEQEQAIRLAAEKVPVVWTANMSLGVNLLLGLVEQVARALGTDWDIDILEMHHRHKVDAPSGTALALGRAAAAGRQVDFEAEAVRSRDGITGPRRAGSIGFATLRGGDVVGDHTVIFAADGERIELSHKASDRRIFARGAVRAALWTRGQRPGLYGMKDVLGI